MKKQSRTELEQDGSKQTGRRQFLKLSALAGASAIAVGTGLSDANAQGNGPQPGGTPNGAGGGDGSDDNRLNTADLVEASITDLQAALSAGRVNSQQLVRKYLKRIKDIDVKGPALNAVIELNPDALDIARALDEERKRSGPRGPLHGIPMLIKDNIDTGDKMQTTAGSLALIGQPAPTDATVAKRLRDAGVIILGKTNLSEWANTRASYSSSGWSGRGGQTHNPYILDRSPCGSSSGSGAAVAASLCAAALGTETDGSITCPAHMCGIVGIKPTVGLVSRAGVIPVSHTQDTVGPHGRTVADAAAVLGALVGVDSRDPATANSAGKFFTDYTQFLDPNGLQGARIGVPRTSDFFGYNAYIDDIIEKAIEIMRNAGAIIVDPANLPSGNEWLTDTAETIVLTYEFKGDLNAYLATRSGVPVHSMADVIAFNEANADRELQFFDQAFMESAQNDTYSDADYQAALARNRDIGGTRGIDAVIDQYQLDALIAPLTSPAFMIDLVYGDRFQGASTSPAAMAGYPLVVVPAGYAQGLPVGINFMGKAYSEPKLIKLAYAFEQATHVRQVPKYLPTVPVNDPSLGHIPRRKRDGGTNTTMRPQNHMHGR